MRNPLLLTAACLLATGGCRSDEERGPRPTPQSTAVGNPGDMTVSVVPVADLDLHSAVLRTDRIDVRTCAGPTVSLAVPTGALDLDADYAVPLGLPESPVRLGGTCGLALGPTSRLLLDGTLTDDGRPLTATLELGAIAVDFEPPSASDTPQLELSLGGPDWLRTEWLSGAGAVAITPGTSLHDTLVEALASGAAVYDRTTNTPLSTPPDHFPLTQPDALVAVGASGRVTFSFDGGAGWTDLITPERTDPTAVLDAVAVAADHPDGPRAVAVGGAETARALKLTPGPEWYEADGVDALPGLRDVVWTGTQFIAVGEAGTVTRSPDGVTWDLDPSVGDCDLLAVAVDGDDALAVGWEGCVYTSSDQGLSWDEGAPLAETGVAIAHIDGVWVVAGADGKLHWSATPDIEWLTKVVDDVALRDVTVSDGWVKAIGDEGIVFTEDFVDFPTVGATGFRRWARTPTGLVALRNTGEVFAAPADDWTLEYWTLLGETGLDLDGIAPHDIAGWPR